MCTRLRSSYGGSGPQRAELGVHARSRLLQPVGRPGTALEPYTTPGSVVQDPGVGASLFPRDTWVLYCFRRGPLGVATYNLAGE